MRVRVWCFALAIALVAALPSGHGAEARTSHALHAVLSTLTSCCKDRSVAIHPGDIEIGDPGQGFSAGAGPFIVMYTHTRGRLDLWMYVVERNQGNVTTGLLSGPGNWLLSTSSADFIATGGVPPGEAGGALQPLDELMADADPTNQGWVVFHLTTRGHRSFTLEWTDCRPGCVGHADEFEPIATVSLSRR